MLGISLWWESTYGKWFYMKKAFGMGLRLRFSSNYIVHRHNRLKLAVVATISVISTAACCRRCLPKAQLQYEMKSIQAHPNANRKLSYSKWIKNGSQLDRILYYFSSNDINKTEAFVIQPAHIYKFIHYNSFMWRIQREKKTLNWISIVKV